MHQSLDQQKQQALMRIHLSRVGMVSHAEEVAEVAATWKSSLPTAQSLGKFSMGLAASWMLKRGFDYFVSRRQRVDAVPLSAKTSFMRYLLLQGCTVILFPLLRKKMIEASQSNIKKSFNMGSIDKMFYRWLGLEN